MAKGYPDYFGTSIWPKYGTPQRDAYAGGMIATGTTGILHSVSGQGVWYYQAINLGVDLSSGDGTISVEVDGEVFFSASLSSIDLACALGRARSPLVCVYFDKGEGIIVMILGFEIPFHSTLEISVTNNTGADIDPTSVMLHYVVV